MKKKLLSLMVVMSLVVSMTLGVTGCGSKSSDSDKKVLKVAFECAYAPYNWTQESPEVGNGKQAVKIKNADGYAYGYEVELAQRIADEMGYELEVYKIEWSSILMGLQDGSLFDNGVWSHNSRLHPNTLQLKLGLLCDDAFMDELFEKMDKGLAQALSK